MKPYYLWIGGDLVGTYATLAKAMTAGKRMFTKAGGRDNDQDPMVISLLDEPARLWLCGGEWGIIPD